MDPIEYIYNSYGMSKYGTLDHFRQAVSTHAGAKKVYNDFKFYKYDDLNTFYRAVQLPPLKDYNSYESLEYSDINNIKNYIGTLESDNDYKAINKEGSSASGKYQVLLDEDGDHFPTIKKRYGITSKDEWLNNPEAQEDYMDYSLNEVLKPRLEELRDYAIARGKDYSDKELLYILHHSWVRDGKKFIDGDNTIPGYENLKNQIAKGRELGLSAPRSISDKDILKTIKFEPISSRLPTRNNSKSLGDVDSRLVDKLEPIMSTNGLVVTAGKGGTHWSKEQKKGRSLDMNFEDRSTDPHRIYKAIQDAKEQGLKLVYETKDAGLYDSLIKAVPELKPYLLDVSGSKYKHVSANHFSVYHDDSALERRNNFASDSEKRINPVTKQELNIWKARIRMMENEGQSYKIKKERLPNGAIKATKTDIKDLTTSDRREITDQFIIDNDIDVNRLSDDDLLYLYGYSDEIASKKEHAKYLRDNLEAQLKDDSWLGIFDGFKDALARNKLANASIPGIFGDKGVYLDTNNGKININPELPFSPGASNYLSPKEILELKSHPLSKSPNDPNEAYNKHLREIQKRIIAADDIELDVKSRAASIRMNLGNKELGRLEGEINKTLGKENANRFVDLQTKDSKSELTPEEKEELKNIYLKLNEAGILSQIQKYSEIYNKGFKDIEELEGSYGALSKYKLLKQLDQDNEDKRYKNSSTLTETFRFLGNVFNNFMYELLDIHGDMLGGTSMGAYGIFDNSRENTVGARNNAYFTEERTKAAAQSNDWWNKAMDIDGNKVLFDDDGTPLNVFDKDGMPIKDGLLYSNIIKKAKKKLHEEYGDDVSKLDNEISWESIFQQAEIGTAKLAAMIVTGRVIKGLATGGAKNAIEIAKNINNAEKLNKSTKVAKYLKRAMTARKYEVFSMVPVFTGDMIKQAVDEGATTPRQIFTTMAVNLGQEMLIERISAGPIGKMLAGKGITPKILSKHLGKNIQKYARQFINKEISYGDYLKYLGRSIKELGVDIGGEAVEGIVSEFFTPITNSMLNYALGTYYDEDAASIRNLVNAGMAEAVTSLGIAGPRLILSLAGAKTGIKESYAELRDDILQDLGLAQAKSAAVDSIDSVNQHLKIMVDNQEITQEQADHFSKTMVRAAELSNFLKAEEEGVDASWAKKLFKRTFKSEEEAQAKDNFDKYVRSLAFDLAVLENQTEDNTETPKEKLERLAKLKLFPEYLKDLAINSNKGVYSTITPTYLRTTLKLNDESVEKLKEKHETLLDNALADYKQADRTAKAFNINMYREALKLQEEQRKKEEEEDLEAAKKREEELAKRLKILDDLENEIYKEEQLENLNEKVKNGTATKEELETHTRIGKRVIDKWFETFAQTDKKGNISIPEEGMLDLIGKYTDLQDYIIEKAKEIDTLNFQNELRNSEEFSKTGSKDIDKRYALEESLLELSNLLSKYDSNLRSEKDKLQAERDNIEGELETLEENDPQVEVLNKKFENIHNRINEINIDLDVLDDINNEGVSTKTISRLDKKSNIRKFLKEFVNKTSPSRTGSTKGNPKSHTGKGNKGSEKSSKYEDLKVTTDDINQTESTVKINENQENTLKELHDKVFNETASAELPLITTINNQISSLYKIAKNFFERQSAFVKRLLGTNDSGSTDAMLRGAAIGNLLDAIGRDVFSYAISGKTEKDYMEEVNQGASERYNEEKELLKKSNSKEEPYTLRHVKISKKAFKKIVNQFVKIRKHLEKNGFIFLSKDLIVNGNFTEEQKEKLKTIYNENISGVAGALDMIAIDHLGNIHIIDFKNVSNNKGYAKNNIIDGYKDEESLLKKWSRQQSIYARLLSKKLGTAIKSINALPIITEYTITEKTKGKLEYEVVELDDTSTAGDLVIGSNNPIFGDNTDIVILEEDHDIIELLDDSLYKDDSGKPGSPEGPGNAGKGKSKGKGNNKGKGKSDDKEGDTKTGESESKTLPEKIADLERQIAEKEAEKKKALDREIPVKFEKIKVDTGNDLIVEIRVQTFTDGSVKLKTTDTRSKRFDTLSDETIQDYLKFDYAEDAKGIIETTLIRDDFSDEDSLRATNARIKSNNEKYDPEITKLKKQLDELKKDVSPEEVKVNKIEKVRANTLKVGDYVSFKGIVRKIAQIVLSEDKTYIEHLIFDNNEHLVNTTKNKPEWRLLHVTNPTEAQLKNTTPTTRQVIGSLNTKGGEPLLSGTQFGFSSSGSLGMYETIALQEIIQEGDIVNLYIKPDATRAIGQGILVYDENGKSQELPEEFIVGLNPVNYRDIKRNLRKLQESEGKYIGWKVFTIGHINLKNYAIDSKRGNIYPTRITKRPVVIAPRTWRDENGEVGERKIDSLQIQDIFALLPYSYILTSSFDSKLSPMISGITEKDGIQNLNKFLDKYIEESVKKDLKLFEKNLEDQELNKNDKKILIQDYKDELSEYYEKVIQNIKGILEKTVGEDENVRLYNSGSIIAIIGGSLTVLHTKKNNELIEHMNALNDTLNEFITSNQYSIYAPYNSRSVSLNTHVNGFTIFERRDPNNKDLSKTRNISGLIEDYIYIGDENRDLLISKWKKENRKRKNYKLTNDELSELPLFFKYQDKDNIDDLIKEYTERIKVLEKNENHDNTEKPTLTKAETKDIKFYSKNQVFEIIGNTRANIDKDNLLQNKIEILKNTNITTLNVNEGLKNDVEGSPHQNQLYIPFVRHLEKILEIHTFPVDNVNNTPLEKNFINRDIHLQGTIEMTSDLHIYQENRDTEENTAVAEEFENKLITKKPTQGETNEGEPTQGETNEGKAAQGETNEGEVNTEISNINRKKKIKNNIDDFDDLKKSTDSETSEKYEGNPEEALKYIKDRFFEIGVEINDTILENLKKLSQETGLPIAKIWGAVHKNMVFLASNSNEVVGKHEALHVAELFFLNKNQRIGIFKEAIKLWGKELGINTDNIRELNKNQIEAIREKLADIFEEYKNINLINNDSNFGKKFPKITKFLNELRNFIMKYYYLSKSYVTNKKSINQLFFEIENNTLGRDFFGNRKPKILETLKDNLNQDYPVSFRVYTWTNKETVKNAQFIVYSMFTDYLEYHYDTKSLSSVLKNNKHLNPLKIYQHFLKQLNSQFGNIIEDYQEILNDKNKNNITNIINKLTEIRKYSVGEQKNKSFNELIYHIFKLRSELGVTYDEFTKDNINDADLNEEEADDIVVENEDSTNKEMTDTEVDEREAWQIRSIDPMSKSSSRLREYFSTLEISHIVEIITKDNSGKTVINTQRISQMNFDYGVNENYSGKYVHGLLLNYMSDVYDINDFIKKINDLPKHFAFGYDILADILNISPIEQKITDSNGNVITKIITVEEQVLTMAKLDKLVIPEDIFNTEDPVLIDKYKNYNIWILKDIYESISAQTNNNPIKTVSSGGIRKQIILNESISRTAEVSVKKTISSNILKLLKFASKGDLRISKMSKEAADIYKNNIDNLRNNLLDDVKIVQDFIKNIKISINGDKINYKPEYFKAFRALERIGNTLGVELNSQFAVHALGSFKDLSNDNTRIVLNIALEDIQKILNEEYPKNSVTLSEKSNRINNIFKDFGKLIATYNNDTSDLSYLTVEGENQYAHINGNFISKIQAIWKKGYEAKKEWVKSRTTYVVVNETTGKKTEIPFILHKLLPFYKDLLRGNYDYQIYSDGFILDSDRTGSGKSFKDYTALDIITSSINMFLGVDHRNSYINNNRSLLEGSEDRHHEDKLQHSLFVTGILSDAPKRVALKAPVFQKEEVLERLVDTIFAELDRIEHIKNLGKDANLVNISKNGKAIHVFPALNGVTVTINDKTVNYTDMKVIDPNTSVINAEKGIILTFPNGRQVQIDGKQFTLRSITESIVKVFLNDEYNKFLEKLKELGQISIKNIKGDINISLTRDSLIGKTLLNVVEKGDIAVRTNVNQDKLRLYVYNAFYNETIFQQVFNGDPAHYKPDNKTQPFTAIDTGKRNKQSIAPYIPKLFKKKTFSVVVLSDVELKSDFYSRAKNEDVYSDITDAGAYHTLQRRKDILEASPEWDILRTTYEPIIERLEKNEYTSEKELKNDLKKLHLQIIKPFFYDMVPKLVETADGNTIAMNVPIQLKDAERVLLPTEAYGLKGSTWKYKKPEKLEDITEETYKRPELARILYLMKKGNVDLVTFKSASKDENITPLSILDIKDEQELQEKVEQHRWDLNNSMWGIQQAMPRKDMNAKVLEGSQEPKIMSADVDPKFVFKSGGKVYRGTAGVNFLLQHIQSKNSLFNYKAIKSMFVDAGNAINTSKIYSILKDLFLENDIDIDLLDGFEIDEHDKMPLRPIELLGKRGMNKLNAPWKKMSRFKMNGAALINIPSLGYVKDGKASTNGFSDGLKMVTKMVNGKEVLEHFEAIVPVYDPIIYKYINVDGSLKLDDSGKPLIPAKMLDAFFYRIPTEGKYSMFPIKIVGFSMPAQGGGVILPREATTMAGLDFDADKVYGYYYNFKYDTHKVYLDKIKKAIGYDNLSKKNQEFFDDVIFKLNNNKLRINSDTYELDNLEKIIKVYGKEKADLIQNIAKERASVFEEEGIIAPLTPKIIESGEDSPEALANLKLDLYLAIAKTPKYLESIKTPGNKDRLIELRNQYEGTKEKYPDSYASVAANVDRASRNITGKRLVGIFANANAFISMIQGVTRVELENTVRINNNEYVYIGDGISQITKDIAEFLFSSTEDVKDPVLEALGINEATAGLLITLLSLSGERVNTERSSRPGHKLTLNEAIEIIKHKDIQDAGRKALQTGKRLTDTYVNTEGPNLSNLIRIAASFSTLVTAAKIDSEIGPSILDVENKLVSIDNIEKQLGNDTYPFTAKSVRSILPFKTSKSKITKLNIYRKALEDELLIYSEVYSFLKPNFNVPKKLLHGISKGGKLPPKLYVKALYYLLDVAIHKYIGANYDAIFPEDYEENQTAQAQPVDELSNSDLGIFVSQDTSNLPVKNIKYLISYTGFGKDFYENYIFPEGTESLKSAFEYSYKTGLTLRWIDNNSKDIIDTYRSQFGLLFTKDPAMAKKLALYAFLKGTNYKATSLLKILPSIFFETEEGRKIRSIINGKYYDTIAGSAFSYEDILALLYLKHKELLPRFDKKYLENENPLVSPPPFVYNIQYNEVTHEAEGSDVYIYNPDINEYQKFNLGSRFYNYYDLIEFLEDPIEIEDNSDNELLELIQSQKDSGFSISFGTQDDKENADDSGLSNSASSLKDLIELARTHFQDILDSVSFGTYLGADTLEDFEDISLDEYEETEDSEDDLDDDSNDDNPDTPPGGPTNPTGGNDTSTEETEDLEDYEFKSNSGTIKLNDDQKKAYKEIENFIENDNRKTHSLIGYAGTGKTLLVNFIRKNLLKNRSVVFASPTHRANQNFKYDNEGSSVGTLHSILGLSPNLDLKDFNAEDIKFIRKNKIKLQRGDFLIIDEASMMSKTLFQEIKRIAKDFDIKILLVGDNEQLGAVDKDNTDKDYDVLQDTEKQSYLTIVERADNPALLEESFHVRNKGVFSYITNFANGKGVKFTNNAKDFVALASKMFKSAEFKKNPLLLRILTGTNKETATFNKQIRENLFGKDANPYEVGELLMGYSSWGVDFGIKNGSDYIISEVNETQKVIEGNVYNGYSVELYDVRDSGKTPFSIFILDHNNDFDQLGKDYDAIYQRAKQTGYDLDMAIEAFKSQFVTPVDIYHKGRVKIKKVLDYGYAHTIHKSQGGTYTNTFLSDISINRFQDATQRKNLRYVGVSRSKSATYVLTDEKIKNNTPLDIDTDPISNTTEFTDIIENIISSKSYLNYNQQDSIIEISDSSIDNISKNDFERVAKELSNSINNIINSEYPNVGIIANVKSDDNNNWHVSIEPTNTQLEYINAKTKKEKDKALEKLKKEFLQKDIIRKENSDDWVNDDIETIILNNEVDVNIFIDSKIASGEIVFRDENNNPCAKYGGRAEFTPGNEWEIVTQFEGNSHAQGGIDINISDRGIRMSRNGGLFKAQNGLYLPKTVSEIYEEKTGKPWSTAKEEGLTSGSYEDNIRLRNQLLSNAFENNENNFSNSQVTRRRFVDAFNDARNQLGPNQIFEYNGQIYTTNKAGEEFLPSEEVLNKYHINNSTVRKNINRQNFQTRNFNNIRTDNKNNSSMYRSVPERPLVLLKDKGVPANFNYITALNNPNITDRNVKVLKEPYLGDFRFTDADLKYINDPRNKELYCPTGNCLKVAWEAYDKSVANKNPLFKSSWDIKKDMNIESTLKTIYDTASPELRKHYDSILYMNPAKGDFSADSGDIHGIIVDTGGQNIYSSKKSKNINEMSDDERKSLYSKMTLGTVIGYGNYTYAGDFNAKKGLPINNHSAIVVGFADDGVPIIYDGSKYFRFDATSNYSSPAHPTMELTNISVPKTNKDFNKEYLVKNQLYDTFPDDLNFDYSELSKQGDKVQLDKFYNSLKNHKKTLMSDLGISSNDYDNFSKLLMSISMQETRGGTNTEHKYQKMLGTTFGDTQGLTQLNIRNILNDPKLSKIAKKYGITKERDLFNPEKAAIASLIYATRNASTSKENYLKGKNPGIRKITYNNRGTTFTSEGFLTEELPNRVPVFNYFRNARNLEDIQKDLDKISNGRYKIKKENGELYIEKKTKGNKPELTDNEKFIYNWQSPSALYSGDAQGDSNYVRQILEYFNKLK